MTSRSAEVGLARRNESRKDHCLEEIAVGSNRWSEMKETGKDGQA